MSAPLLLEVIVQSVEDALAAQAGGADRLEVVREIQRDGLTPPIDLVRAIAAEVQLPLRVMVRESDGFTVTGARELLTLQRAFAALADLGVDGAVVGYARGGNVDVETTTAVLYSAPGLRVTFHRAFDRTADPFASLETLRALPQIDRVLTSGGDGDWTARARRLAELAEVAGDALVILPGGGVDDSALRALAATAAIHEAHVGKAACEPQVTGAPVSAERVRMLKKLTLRPDGSRP